MILRRKSHKKKGYNPFYRNTREWITKNFLKEKGFSETEIKNGLDTLITKGMVGVVVDYLLIDRKIAKLKRGDSEIKIYNIDSNGNVYVLINLEGIKRDWSGDIDSSEYWIGDITYKVTKGERKGQKVHKQNQLIEKKRLKTRRRDQPLKKYWRKVGVKIKMIPKKDFNTFYYLTPKGLYEGFLLIGDEENADKLADQIPQEVSHFTITPKDPISFQKKMERKEFERILKPIRDTLRGWFGKFDQISWKEIIQQDEFVEYLDNLGIKFIHIADYLDHIIEDAILFPKKEEVILSKEIHHLEGGKLLSKTFLLESIDNGQLHYLKPAEREKWFNKFLEEFGDKIEKVVYEERDPSVLYRWNSGERKGQNIYKEIISWDLSGFELEEVIRLKKENFDITPTKAIQQRMRGSLKEKGIAMVDLSLKDFGFKEGNVEIWYAKSSKDPKKSWFHWEYNYQKGNLDLPNNYEELRETHKHLGNTAIEDPNKIFSKLQAFNWGKPAEKSNKFIDSKGLNHTSMSVGDIIIYPNENKALIVKGIGFEEIPFQANKKRLKSGLITSTFLIGETQREMNKKEKTLLEKWKEHMDFFEGVGIFNREMGRRNPATITSLNEIIKQKGTHIGDEDDYIRWQNDQFKLAYNDWQKDLTKEEKKTLEKMEKEVGLLPFQEAFNSYTEFNVEVLYNYNVLVMDKTRSYSIVFEGITGHPDNVKRNEEFREFKELALKYIDKEEFNTLLRNVGGGEYLGYVGLIINAEEIVEAIKEGKNSIKGEDIIVGLHRRGEGWFEYADYGSPSFEIDIDNLRLDFGWGSVGDVFSSSAEWKH